MKGFVTTSKGINHKREVNKAKWGMATNSKTNCSKGDNQEQVSNPKGLLDFDVNCEKRVF